MTVGSPAPTATRQGGGRLLVAVFAVTQTVGYGVLIYAFSVVLQPIAADLQTSVAVVTGAMTLAVVVAGLTAIPVGRWLDRHGGRLLMTGGSVLGVAAVVAWSQVRTVGQLYAVFAAIGLASAMALYEAAFAVVVATVEPSRRTDSLVAITIVAGLSSSIFFPLTGYLLEHLGWRDALLTLAVLLAVVTVPGHAFGVPGRRRHREGRTSRGGAGVRDAMRDGGFWVLMVAFVAHSAAISAMAVHIIRLLRSAGHSVTVAATLSGLIGVLSVTGRLVTTALVRRYSIGMVTAVVFAVQALGVAVLPFVGDTLVGAIVGVTAFGLGFGVGTIARPAILADRYGTARFATIVGAMTAPITLAKAAAPLAAASLGLTSFSLAAAIACLLAAVMLGVVQVACRATIGHG